LSAQGVRLPLRGGVVRRTFGLAGALLAGCGVLAWPAGAQPVPQIHTVAGGGTCVVPPPPATPVPPAPCDGVPATAVPINHARGVAALPDGSFLYIDYYNDLVREVSPSGTVTTVAGNGTTTDAPPGTPAVQSGLNGPIAVAPLPGGGFLVTEYKGSVVRLVSPDATITTIAGTGTPGNNGLSGQATSIKLNWPTDAEPTADGRVLIADRYNNYVRVLSAAAPGATIDTIAGGGTACDDVTPDCEGAAAGTVRLHHPVSVSPLQGGGGGYVVAEDVNAVRKVSQMSSSGTFSTVAGSPGKPGFGGDGGPATAAQLNNPQQVASTADGGFLIADTNNQRIRQVSASGTISTVAGNGIASFAGDGGPATAASLEGPTGVSPTANGTFLIADADNNAIRLTTLAPTSMIALSAPDGQDGWYVSTPPHATITATGGAAIRCELDPGAPPPAFDALPASCPYLGGGADITGDGPHTLYAASVNGYGDKEVPVSVSFQIDQAKPGIQCATAPSFIADTVGQVVTATLTDSISGPASALVTAPADTSRLGDRHATVTGANTAGGSATTQCAYKVLPAALSPSPAVVWAFAPGAHDSTVKQLVVTRVAARAAINVTCKGTGCPFASARNVTGKTCAGRRCKPTHQRTPPDRTHTVNLTPLFAHHRLAAGTQLTVSVTKHNTVGRVILFAIRPGSDPSYQVSCLVPGSSGPSPCKKGSL
jgi:hypothetical protein